MTDTKTKNWEISLGGINGWDGFVPAYTENNYPYWGNKNQASAMTDVNLIDANVLTQGPGIANLTGGSHAGEMGEYLIVAITKKPTSSNVVYACSASKVFQISNTAVLNGTFPLSITGGTYQVATDLIHYAAAVYVFWNDTGTEGEIAKVTLPSTIDVDWGCYSEDTEVLTIDGWKLVKDVTVGENVYSYNPDTKNVEIAINTETINKSYNREMVSFRSEGIDLLVTPDHKMLAGFRKYNDKKVYLDYQIVRADSLLNKTNFHLRKNANWNGEVVDYWDIPAYENSPTKIVERNKLGQIIKTSGKTYKKEIKKIPIKTFLTFLGFYISEGHCVKSGKQIGISQSKEKNFYTWEIIKKNLNELGFSYTENKRGDGFTINDKQLCEYIKSFVKGKSYEKYIPKEILRLDKSLLIYLYESLMLGDGYLGTNQYYTSSPKLRDDFVELVNRLGWSARMWERDNRGKEVLDGRIVKRIQYVIGVTKQKNEQIFNRQLEYKNGEAHTKTENYKGRIVCLVLDKNHIMLVRRNGKQVWCGNSTVPTGAAALQDAPHYAIVGGDNVMYFTNGIYVGTYDGTTLAPTALDFHTDSQVVSLTWNHNRVKIAVNRPNITGSNFNQSAIYTWNGVSSSWEGDPIEVQGEIGALYTKNGVDFVWWKDSITTGGYQLGYINGTRLIPLRRYSGSLPNQAQVGEYDGFLAWLSSEHLYLWGSKDADVPVKMFQYMSAMHDTAIGAFAAPFGTPLISSHQYAVFTAAADDIVTSAAHGLVDDDTVRLTTTNTLPGGLSTATTYYVIEADTNTFELSASEGGTKINITGTGTGTHTWHQYSLGKASGYATTMRYKSKAFSLSRANFRAFIDIVQIEFETLATGAKTDITITYNKAASSQACTQVAYSATDATTRRKILNSSFELEDFRVDISAENGSVTNSVKIRSIFLAGRYVTDN